MSNKSAQAKRQLRNEDGTFANENKNAGLPSNDMIQHAKSLLDSKSEAEENVLTSPFLAMSERVDLCERYLAGEVEDTDGTLEYLTNQAKTIEERNDGSQVLTDTWDDARDEDIEWATRQLIASRLPTRTRRGNQSEEGIPGWNSCILGSYTLPSDGRSSRPVNRPIATGSDIFLHQGISFS